jgi:hypothetical protein
MGGWFDLKFGIGNGVSINEKLKMPSVMIVRCSGSLIL